MNRIFREYLHENELLSLFIGGPDGFNLWKNIGRKSRDTAP